MESDIFLRKVVFLLCDAEIRMCYITNIQNPLAFAYVKLLHGVVLHNKDKVTAELKT